MIQVLYVATLFQSALLLFWIQPLAGKALLPGVGGSAMVWQTSLAFFQFTLLAGYTYAHWHARSGRMKIQGWVHILLVLMACAALPLSSGLMAPGSEAPTDTLPLMVWTTLLKGLGIPLLVLSCHSPLLQWWWSRGRHPGSGDPYYLYAASNCGSLTGLFLFPILLEPVMDMERQLWLWRALFVLTGVMALICRYWLPLKPILSGAAETPPHGGSPGKPSKRKSAFWLFHSFLPCGLMLAVTGYLTHHLVNMPLFGAMPLGLFLLAYILAFQNKKALKASFWNRFMLGASCLLCMTRLADATHPVWLVTSIHLATLFSACMVLHTRMAVSRPPTRWLTQYYFIMALGGVMAGLLQVFVFPLIFDRYWEYPILLGLAAWTCALPRPAASFKKPLSHNYLPLLWILLPALAALGVRSMIPTGLNPQDGVTIAWKAGLPTLLLWWVMKGNQRIGVTALCMLFAIAEGSERANHTPLIHARNHFGTFELVLERTSKRRLFFHGNTLHGSQSTDPQRQALPLNYYHQSGPLRRIFKQFEASDARPHVGVIGLGVGAIAAYARPHESWTFFEIDRDIIQMAKDTRYFTYLAQIPNSQLRITEGDARIKLQEEADATFGLLILDAFSADSIPMHLMTVEALDDYLKKLGPNGILAWHLSNRYLNLENVVARLAQARGLHAVGWRDEHEDPVQGRDPSYWVVMVREKSHLGKLLRDDRFTSPDPGKATEAPWTDQQSSLWQAIHW
ncbi:MAG: fused MFS/spermidine synthase [Verrucomicrobiota bacterium]|nr:fused MFS/spermidine synthase [Verrucomicrobiota bacterium]